jgi:transposase
MDKPLSEILKAIPPKPPRSKLEPHYDLIRELRRRSKTYREIAKILEEHVGLHVDHSTICDFTGVRL